MLSQNRDDRKQTALELEYAIRGIRDIQKFAQGATGLAVAAYTQVYDDAFFHPDTYRKDYSPFEHLRPKPKDEGLDLWFKRAIDLMQSGLVHKTFGLSLADVLSLDPLTFDMLEKYANKLAETHNTVAEDLDAVLKKTTKAQSSQKGDK